MIRIKNNIDMSHEDLLRRWAYDPTSGEFTWKASMAGCRAGDRAGYVGYEGYRGLSYKGKNMREHRVAWFYVHGVWPGVLDHINGDRADNRISNLREVSQSQNIARRTYRRNKAGFRGVFQRSPNCYSVKIRHEKRIVFEKVYSTAEEAAAAYDAEVIKLHGEYAVTNALLGLFPSARAAIQPKEAQP